VRCFYKLPGSLPVPLPEDHACGMAWLDIQALFSQRLHNQERATNA
jgi:hypothetical protein